MAPIGSESLVHIENFRMDFGRTTVIRGLSFDIKAGETFGFLGSNGSGKTTTIRALLGIYILTAGTLHINGRDFSPELGGKLGYLPEERGLYKAGGDRFSPQTGSPTRCTASPSGRGERLAAPQP